LVWANDHRMAAGCSHSGWSKGQVQTGFCWAFAYVTWPEKDCDRQRGKGKVSGHIFLRWWRGPTKWWPKIKCVDSLFM